MPPSRYTAQGQYGMVGYGAGPGDSTVAAPSNASAVATLANGNGNGDGQPANGRANGADPASSMNFVLPGRIMEDPTFWMVASLGAVIFLAAYSAGQ